MTFSIFKNNSAGWLLYHALFKDIQYLVKNQHITSVGQRENLSP